MFSSTFKRVKYTFISVQLRALLAHVFQSARFNMFRANYLDIYHFVPPDDKGTHFPSQFSHPSRTLSAATRTCFSSVEERRCRRVYCSLSARTAPRRTSYPAACGASTLIGSSTRTTACAFRQLLIGLSGQVVQVTSAPLRTVVAGR